MVLSVWKRKRTSRENEPAKFEARIRTIVASDDVSMLEKEVCVEKDFFVNKKYSKYSKCWRYSIPVPKKHPIRLKSPYVLHKMSGGFSTKEAAMTVADVEAHEMGYKLISPFKLTNDIG